MIMFYRRSCLCLWQVVRSSLRVTGKVYFSALLVGILSAITAAQNLPPITAQPDAKDARQASMPLNLVPATSADRESTSMVEPVQGVSTVELVKGRLPRMPNLLLLGWKLTAPALVCSRLG